MSVAEIHSRRRANSLAGPPEGGFSAYNVWGAGRLWNPKTISSPEEKRTADPSCLVLDVRLPQMSGLDFQRQLAEIDVQIPIIFITAHGDIPMSVRVLKSGAVEFLTKPFRDQDLLDAIQQALQRDRTLREQRAEIKALHERYQTLTTREREVMTLVVSGMLNKHISAKIGASEATVKIHPRPRHGEDAGRIAN